MEREPKKAVKSEMLLTPEMEFKGDFENISTPEQFLDAVDFETLNRIFDTLQRHSAHEEDIKSSGHRVTPENIEFKAPARDGESVYSSQGSALPATGRILLKWDFPENQRIEPSELINVLSTLMHESAHIRGGYEHVTLTQDYSSDDHRDWISTVQSKAGLEVTNREYRGVGVEGTRHDKVYGLNLNEAVTEDIAHHVLKEYLIQTGNTSYLKDTSTLEKIGSGAYLLERMVLFCAIDEISKDTEVPASIVWNALVSAYMAGSSEVLGIMEDFAWQNRDNELRLVTAGLVDDVKIEKHTNIDGLLQGLGELNDLQVMLSENNLEKAFELLENNKQILSKRSELLNSVKFKSKVLSDALGLRK